MKQVSKSIFLSSYQDFIVSFDNLCFSDCFFLTINKKKQDILLDKLQGENSMKRLIKGSKILGNLGNDDVF